MVTCGGDTTQEAICMHACNACMQGAQYAQTRKCPSILLDLIYGVAFSAEGVIESR